MKLYFFGPAEQLLLTDKKLQALLGEYQNENEIAIACKYVAEEGGISHEFAALDVPVQYVGAQISTLIKEGYTPLVW